MDSTRSGGSGGASAWILAAAALLVVLPVALDLALSGRGRVFAYLAADAWYYLTVARNALDHGLVSFDQHHLTNGFHPLWQYTLVGVFALGRGLGLGETAVLQGVVVLGAVFCAAGLVFLGAALARSRPLTPFFLTLPVGAYALAVAPLWLAAGEALPSHNVYEGSLPLQGTLWSYANGMESSAVVLALGVFAAVWCRPPLARVRGHAAVLGLALALLTFARLDHVFLSVAFLGMLALAPPVRSRRLETLLVAGGVYAALLGAYLVVNRTVFDAWLPVSGSLKSSFPSVHGPSFRHLVAVLSDLPDFRIGILMRHVRLWLPLAVALGFLAARWPELRALARGSRVGAEPAPSFLDFLALGVVAMGLYDLLFVPVMAQGPWYFAATTLFVGLVAVRILDGWARRWQRAVAPLAASAVIVLASVAVFVGLHRHPDTHARYARFYFDEGPRLRDLHGASPPGLVSFDDGIVAFATGFPTLSATGFMLDPAALEARRQGRLLRLATERGYDHLTSLVYLSPWVTPALGAGQPAALRAYASRVVAGDDLDGFAFELAHYTPKPAFAIVRATPRWEATRPDERPRR